ncbi:flagellar type III secretion system protein FliR [Brevundimonas sp. BAL450]|jgi:flagellar biosynthesis protein FliR|uniref:Flagellar biosynthetic protein FliR n=1 Tax=Brevundimonas abyssalis TAR-001 TaxID=1391729 RepID=A0A8E0N830_9CAUL|nr:MULTISPECIES: flagellar biosynthetic protein FliR [Brevundimonas]MBG7613823.1 flagellar type III secretion system protein FliR [Brevundimonas sp. BAL450]GAD58109.1 flagellar biosynthesis protein fliR [Brevundimonas abyssalis TAR-001]
MEPYAAADQVWAGGLIFARVGAMLMTIPGVGEAYVPPRIRLSMALVISIALAPVVVGYLPPLPATMGGVAGWVIREVATGLMIGALLRMMLSALATAGEIVSLQTTLAFAQTANPFQAQPGSTLAAFLTLLGVTLIFATDTHHLFIAGLAGSYEVIPPVSPLLLNDFAAMAVRTVGDSFLLGVQLAAPVLVFSMIFNLASGLVGRVMPQFQIFFATAPLSIILGLSVFALSLGVVGTVFIERFRTLAMGFTGGAGG